MTLREFIIAVLQDCLAYQQRFQQEIGRLESEGWTIVAGNAGDYRIWRTNELLLSMPSAGAHLDFEAIANRCGIERPYHLDRLFADIDDKPLSIPGLPAKLVEEWQYAVWNLGGEDVTIMAEFVVWPVDRVREALADPQMRPER